MMKALQELAGLAAKGQGDFSGAGALALAGGEDDDTKLSAAKASLRQLSSGSRGEKVASIDLGYTVTNTAEDDVTIVVSVSGTLTVLDAPARYSTLSLQGNMELKPTKPGGPQGTGTVKLSMTYK
jgi:hypothetical protein